MTVISEKVIFAIFTDCICTVYKNKIITVMFRQRITFEFINERIAMVDS